MTQQDATYQYLGKGRKLVEGHEKVTGQVKYTGDLQVPGMLYGQPLLSPYAHARIVSIDTSAARALPGVVAVLTAGDLATRDRASSSRQTITLARDVVLFRGHPVAVVVAESEAAARDATDLVIVEYEPLPVVADIDTALAADAQLLWPNGVPKDGEDLTAAHGADMHDDSAGKRPPSNILDENHHQRGDLAAGFAQADVVVERTYETAIVHQGYLEPHAVVAEPDGRGGLTVYTSTQGQFGVRNEVARLLGLQRSKVTVVPMTVGGGFGAKYGILEPLVAATALAVNAPVRIVLTRSEDFLTTTPSPATRIELKVGATQDGTLTALQARVYLDNGLYPFALGGIVSTLLGGYYRCDNVQIDCFEVVTHKPQIGAYRAPGAPQATFALESTMDELAHRLERDPLEFRLQNAVRGGDLSGSGKPWPHIGLHLCLERLREHPLWQQRNALGPNEGLGIAIGGWPCAVSPAASVCRVDTDGTVRIHVGSVDISGTNSSFALVAAEILAIPPDQVEIVPGDTRSGPFAGPSGGSQITYGVAGAIANAAREAKRQLLEIAVDHFEARIEDLELRDGKVQVRGVPGQAVPIARLAQIAETKRGGPGPIVGEGRESISENAPGFVAHLAHVHVDPDTGRVTPLHYVAVQDVGFALNPLMVEGQIHGGSAQGIGYGLYEAMRYDTNGELLTATFMDYDLPKITALPPIEAIQLTNPSPYGPFGARGVGEPPITAGPAALANAVFAATGARIAELPLRDELVWRALHGAE